MRGVVKGKSPFALDKYLSIDIPRLPPIAGTKLLFGIFSDFGLRIKDKKKIVADRCEILIESVV